jgi:hypothetical protein
MEKMVDHPCLSIVRRIAAIACNDGVEERCQAFALQYFDRDMAGFVRDYEELNSQGMGLSQCGVRLREELLRNALSRTSRSEDVAVCMAACARIVRIGGPIVRRRSIGCMGMPQLAKASSIENMIPGKESRRVPSRSKKIACGRWRGSGIVCGSRSRP